MADIKIAYGSSSSLTITLASLATSSTLLVGRVATAIDNTTNKYIDYLLAGKITTGTTPTVDKSIRVYAVGSLEDTPSYPDAISATDAAATITNANIRNTAFKIAAVMNVTADTDIAYYFGPISMASLFGGHLPKYFNIFVTHDTAQPLNSTASNHVLSITPAYFTSV